MRITVVAVGSQGDIQPYLALAVGLQKEGHSVRFAANVNFAAFSASHGVEFFPIQVDSLEISNSMQAQTWYDSGSMLTLLLNTQRVVRPLIHQFLADILDACRGSDLIIYHSFALPFAYFVGRELDIPSIPASIDPLPTRAHPALALNVNWSRNGAFNLFTHWLVDVFAWRVFLPELRKSWRGKIDITKVNPYRQLFKEQELVLCGYSPAVVSRPADLPDHIVITGYWFLDPAPGWNPPADLVEFIDSGPRPVYIGFGSIGNPREGNHTADIILRALAETGQRAVLGAGWSEMGTGRQLPKDVFLLKSIPHAWLFPRMAAVVHHAGPGTTAAGLSAGIPNVTVPHFGSHHFYGKQIADRGAGPRPINRKKLSAERLAQAIDTAVRDQGIKDRALALGMQIRAEEGVQHAVREIRRFMNQRTIAPNPNI